MPNAKQRSLRGLDWTNFLMADLQTGVGPFLAMYLTAVRHWDPGTVGLVVCAQSIVTVATQVPAGALVDWSRNKKRLLVVATAMISLGCIGVVVFPNVPLELLSQGVMGVAAAVFIPSIAAVSIGLVGRRGLPPRIGRNEAMNHAGNVTFATLAAFVGTRFGVSRVFLLATLFSAATALAAGILMRNEDIDHREARGAAAAGDDRASALGALVRDRRIPIFLATITLFHLANGAMLPMVGELLTRTGGRASAYMSACIVVAQVAMIPVALMTARLSDSWGRKPLFVVAFVVLALRGACYLFIHDPLHLASLQVLDAVSAGIFGVLWSLVAADLASGTGRFALVQGATQAAVGVGVFLSNLVAGYVARAFGHPVAFAGLACVAAVGAAVYALLMPETADVHPRAAAPALARAR